MTCVGFVTLLFVYVCVVFGVCFGLVWVVESGETSVLIVIFLW